MGYGASQQEGKMQAFAGFTASPDRPRLRIGVLLNGGLQPAWVAAVLEQIAHSGFARVELVVCNVVKEAREPLPRRVLKILRDGKARRTLLFRLYARWDRRRIAVPDDPLRATDCSGLVKDAEWMQVDPLRKGPVDRFPDEAITRIRGLNLDVLLRFGFNILRGEILTAARCGVWSYHHGDNEFYRGGPPCFWEVVEGNPLTGALLQVLTEELDAGRVLYKGLFATDGSGSWSRNRLQPYWGATGFVAQRLRRLHEQGWEQVEREMVPAAAYRGRRKLYRTPTNLEMLGWMGRRLARRAWAAVSRLPRGLSTDHWRLAVRVGAQPRLVEDLGADLGGLGFVVSHPFRKERGMDGAPSFLKRGLRLAVSPVSKSRPGAPGVGGLARLAEGSTADLGGFLWMQPPRGHFYADPFLFGHEGRRWLFFEDFEYGTRRGTIAVAEVLDDGELSAVRRVLERPYHLSYPCVFRAGEEMYMIPETRAHGTVEMYRARRFPDEWEMVREFLQVSAVDTTVYSEGGTHWFFVTLREPRAGALELWLFSSQGILDDWRAHPANPISTDVRSSRGGGAVYRDGGRLIRPSQDCSGNYGRSFTLNEIMVMNEEEYRERPLVTVAAPAGMTGTHTYARLEDVEVIDGSTLEPVFRVMERGMMLDRVGRKLGIG